MSASGSNGKVMLGYLALAECEDHGFVGGYLIVNQLARPVEFHCTAPVRPSRTQEILFGATLRAAVFCDQISRALLAQSKQKPTLLIVDEPEVLALRSQINIPMALLINGDVPSPATADSTRPNDADDSTHSPLASTTRTPVHTVVDANSEPRSGLKESWSFEIGGACLTTEVGFADDQQVLRSALRDLPPGWDLAEPLERIRTAITEAQRSAA